MLNKTPMTLFETTCNIVDDRSSGISLDLRTISCPGESQAADTVTTPQHLSGSIMIHIWWSAGNRHTVWGFDRLAGAGGESMTLGVTDAIGLDGKRECSRREGEAPGYD